MDHRLKLVKFLIEQKEHRESVNSIFSTMLGMLRGDTGKGAPEEYTTRIMHGIKSLSVVHGAQEGLDKFVEAFGNIANKRANETNKTKWTDMFGNTGGGPAGETRPDSRIIVPGADGKPVVSDIEVKGGKASMGGNLSVSKLIDVDSKILGYEPDIEILVGGNRKPYVISGNPASLTKSMQDARVHRGNPNSTEFQGAIGRVLDTREKINLDADKRKVLMDIQLGPLSSSLSKFVIRPNTEKGQRSIVYTVPSDIARASIRKTGTLGPPSVSEKRRSVLIGARATPESIIKDIPKEQMTELTVHPDEMGILRQYTDETTFNGIHDHLKNSNLVSQ